MRNGQQESPGETLVGIARPAGRKSLARIRKSQLSRVALLGTGAFGLVTLEADRRTGRTYALKAVSKGYLVETKMTHSVVNEKRILRAANSPFIVKLLATYNGREHVYFLLEAALGGELFHTYERLRLYGNVELARFYVACCVEALAHLHSLGVIYRDLKPENLLLDDRGYCKMADMGLAKQCSGLTYTVVGTQEYMAPEVINRKGHSFPADWWTLGILLFELLVGHSPFEDPSPEGTCELISKGIQNVSPPRSLKKVPEALSLVYELCHSNPKTRLGCRFPGRHGPEQIRQDPFFAKFCWHSLREQSMEPPYRPEVKGLRDVSNFKEHHAEDAPPDVPYEDPGTGWDDGFEDDVKEAPMATRVVEVAPPVAEALPAESVAARTARWEAAACGPSRTATPLRGDAAGACSPAWPPQRPMHALNSLTVPAAAGG